MVWKGDLFFLIKFCIFFLLKKKKKLKKKYIPNLKILTTSDLTGNFPKNLTSALQIENDPLMRITARFFVPQDRKNYYYERDRNEMLQTEMAENELTDDFFGFVKKIIK